MADDPKPEVIEQDMAQTRNSLVEKIAALETQVVGTVQSATTAVQDTVQSITSAVQDTTQSVKQGLFGVQDTAEKTLQGLTGGAEKAIQGLTGGVKEAFDVTTRVRDNPLPMVAGAAFAGFVTGLLAFGPKPRSLPRRMSDGTEPRRVSTPGYMAAVAAPAYAPQAAVQAQPKEPSWIDGLVAMAGKELFKLGEQALTQAVGQVKTALDQNVPKLVDNLVQTGTDRVSGLIGQVGQPSTPPAPHQPPHRHN